MAKSKPRARGATGTKYFGLEPITIRPPDTYDDLEAIAEKYIAQGMAEDKALKLAADRCELRDELAFTTCKNEAIQWD